VLESPLEKKAGVNYGPPGTKTLIYFVDDLNMPKLDPYETAMPISLIRQHLGWGHWFDRSKLTQKNINNTQVGWVYHIAELLDSSISRPASCRLTLAALVLFMRQTSRLHRLCTCVDQHICGSSVYLTLQYVACMNPTAGSFVINPRLQRLFMTLAMDFPGQVGVVWLSC
jgi:dynein heavy chain